MLIASDAEAATPRTSAWKWWVCGLLLLATMLNYMDRLTLNLMATQIKADMRLTNEQYGEVEWAFGVAFAFGSLLVGWCVDRWSVRAVYPVAVLGWSAAGFATGFARTLPDLLSCRFILGLFESGNWSCALRTTQRILPPRERTMGNSLLQSGAAVGAILTPLVVLALVRGPGTWRYPFFAIGSLGIFWVVAWLAVVRRNDLPAAPPVADASSGSLWSVYLQRRFLVLVVLVITINLTWHFFRVWLPLLLEENRGYSKVAVQWFFIAYYVATDAGALTAGWATLWLARRGSSVHGARVWVLLAAALLTTLSTVAAFLPKGWLLLGLLLVIGFGALALYPPYYTLSQELTVRHQGKLTGTLGFTTWMVTAAMHPLVGRWLDRTKDYGPAILLAGLVPLLGLAALVFFWGQDAKGVPADDATAG